MFKLSIIIFIILFSVNVVTCFEEYFNYFLDCDKVGSNNNAIINLYDKDYPNLKFLSVEDNIKIDNYIWDLQYCQCNINNGNCIIKYSNFITNENEKKSVIIEYALQDDISKYNYTELYTNFRNNVNKEQSQIYYDKDKEKGVVSKLPSTFDIDFSIIFFSDMKEVYNEKEKIHKLVNLSNVGSVKELLEEGDGYYEDGYYTLKYSILNPSNFKEAQSITLGKFIISNVVECIQNSTTSIKNVYTKKGFQKTNIDCLFDKATYSNPIYFLSYFYTSSSYINTISYAQNAFITLVLSSLLLLL